jgi:hypothetical protein
LEQVNVALPGLQARSDALGARRLILRGQGICREEQEARQENCYTEK